MAVRKKNQDKVKKICIRKKIKKKDPVNERELDLLTQAEIQGVFMVRMEKNHLVYECPKGVHITKYLQQGMTVHRFYLLLAQMVELVKGITDAGLNLRNLQLEKQKIYIKDFTHDLYVIYEPLTNVNKISNAVDALYSIVALIPLGTRELRQEIDAFNEYRKSVDKCDINSIETFILKHYPQIYQQVKRKHKKQEENYVRRTE